MSETLLRQTPEVLLFGSGHKLRVRGVKDLDEVVLLEFRDGDFKGEIQLIKQDGVASPPGETSGNFGPKSRGWESRPDQLEPVEFRVGDETLYVTRQTKGTGSGLVSVEVLFTMPARSLSRLVQLHIVGNTLKLNLGQLKLTGSSFDQILSFGS